MSPQAPVKPDSTAASVSVFEFDRVGEFLEAVRNCYPGRKKPMPLGLWAKRLGFKSPRSIAMVIKGQRMASFEMLASIAADLRLSTSEKRYLELLLQREKAGKAGRGVALIEQEIFALSPGALQRRLLEPGAFSPISEWYILVIKQLAEAPSFIEDPQWISQRLGGSITSEQAENALRGLLDFGLLTRDPKSGRLKAPPENIFTSIDLPSRSGRHHLRQMLELASMALDSRSIAQREFASLTFRFDKKRALEAKKMIREFRDRFDAVFANDLDAEDVFQLNLQFFEHTR